MKKLKEMSFLEKMDYLWTYYKGYFMIPVICCVLFCILYKMEGGTEKEPLLNGVLINQFLQTEVTEAIESKMLEVLHGDKDIQEVYLDAAVSIDLEEQDPDTIANLGKITTYVFSEDLDFMIVEPKIAEHYAKLNGLNNLQNSMPDELLSKFDEAELFLYGEEEAALGIYLKETQFVDDYGIELDNPIFCVIDNSQRKENVWKIIKWMFAKGTN